MDLNLSTWWWLACGAAVVVELLTGTFYLLMLALGLAAAALAAHAGLGVSLQLLAFAGVGGGSVALWHWRRARQPRSAPVQSNPDAHLDIGERVEVEAWGNDGRARVPYRGTQWSARLAPGAAARPGPHQVVAIEGNSLILAPWPAAPTA